MEAPTSTVLNNYYPVNLFCSDAKFMGPPRPEFSLPKYIGAANTEHLFSFCTAIRSCACDFTINGQDVTFIDPLGLTVLVSLLKPIAESRYIRMVWLPVEIGAYMQRMDFFKHCPIDGPLSSTEVRSNLSSFLVEITCVEQEADVSEASHRLATILIGRMTQLEYEDIDKKINNTADISDEFYAFMRPVRYIISELMLNALSHAKRNGRFDTKVWIAAQQYNSESVRIAIVDNGCGMLETLKKHSHLSERTHLAALCLAMQPYVSCNRELGSEDETINQGVGLTVSKMMALRSGGALTIVTGNARSNKHGEREFQGDGFWDGVALCFACQRDKLPHLSTEECLQVIEASEPQSTASLPIRFV